jgi:hypothetical protein
MRFVDMFMTALGSLIFIAMLLVFLLPKTAQTSTDPTVAAKALEAKLKDAEKKLEDLQKLMENVNQVDKHVVKRWLSVTLLTKDCPAYEPTLYVRWEGPTFDFYTGKSMGGLDPFDASNPKMHPLIGNRPFLIGPTSLPGSSAWYGVGPTRLLDGTRLAIASYFAVSSGPGDRSIYIGLRNPRGLMGGECIVHPIIHGWSGTPAESTFKLSLAQPFAFIRRVRLENEGGFTSPQPESDAAFLRELEAFSAEQSQKLCKEKLICGTQDAHWARYAKPAPMLPEALDWRPAYRFTSQADRYDVRSPMTVAECEKACIDDPHCAAVEHDADDRTCALYDVRPLVSGVPGSRWKVGTRTPSPLNWRVDHTVEGGKVYRTLAETSREECAKACLNDAACRTVEYYKPTRACNMFRRTLKVLPSPIGAFAPTDVGVKTKR